MFFRSGFISLFMYLSLYYLVASLFRSFIGSPLVFVGFVLFPFVLFGLWTMAFRSFVWCLVQSNMNVRSYPLYLFRFYFNCGVDFALLARHLGYLFMKLFINIVLGLCYIVRGSSMLRNVRNRTDLVDRVRSYQTLCVVLLLEVLCTNHIVLVHVPD